MKKPTIWLARDGCGTECYVMGIGEQPVKRRNSDLFDGDTDWRPNAFESIAPKSCHLKPGGGPIEITLKFERVK